MIEQTKVMLVEVFPKVAQKISSLLQRIDYIELIPNNISNSENALETIRQIKPEIVLFEMDIPGLTGIQCTEIIRREFPQIQVIILSEVSSADMVRQAMRAGAVDFLNYSTLTFDELLSVIQRATDIVQQEQIRLHQRQQIQKEQVSNGRKAVHTDGKVISVYSPKGGSGVSTIVANLGYVLKEIRPESRVLLMDLDMQYGDISILYNQIPNRSIIDIAIRIQNIDEDLIQSVVFPDETSGVDLLAPPQKIDLASELDTATLTKIITELRKIYDLIIVNVDSYLTESSVSCLTNSDLILLIALQQVAALRSLRACISFLHDLGVGREKFAIILNRFDETSSITPKKIGEMLSVGVSHIIPADMKTTEKAANLGIPFTYDNKKVEISKSYQKLGAVIFNRLLVKEKTAG